MYIYYNIILIDTIKNYIVFIITYYEKLIICYVYIVLFDLCVSHVYVCVLTVRVNKTRWIVEK